MSEQGEFYCVPNDDRTIWDVRRRTTDALRPEFVATFKGSHAEADAREHIERCNARGAEERKAARPKYEVTHFWAAAGKRLWRVCHTTHGPIADFYETQPDAEQRARDYAARLNAEAQPEPPKPPPRFVLERWGDASWAIKDMTRQPGAQAVVSMGVHYDIAEINPEAFARAVADMLNAETAGEDQA